MNNNHLVSVIIPMYNEAGDILNCLESLKLQTYFPFETIVVDDGSTDSSLKIVKNQKGVKLFSQQHLGPGAARNRGALKAKGSILIFVDADMTFDRKFIHFLTRPIREGSTIGTFSREEYVSNNHNFWARNWSINRGLQEGRMHSENHPDKQPVYRAILKQEFVRVGGFDTRVGYTDDWSLATKLKQQASLAEHAIFYHRNPGSPLEVFFQARWMAMRPYKLGLIGRLIALIRASFPLSLLIGVIKSFRYRSPAFLVFRLVFDFGLFCGICRLFISRNRYK